MYTSVHTPYITILLMLSLKNQGSGECLGRNTDRQTDIQTYTQTLPKHTQPYLPYLPIIFTKVITIEGIHDELSGREKGEGRRQEMYN